MSMSPGLAFWRCLFALGSNRLRQVFRELSDLLSRVPRLLVFARVVMAFGESADAHGTAECLVVVARASGCPPPHQRDNRTLLVAAQLALERLRQRRQIRERSVVGHADPLGAAITRLQPAAQAEVA
jgi:hypothetical protein